MRKGLGQHLLIAGVLGSFDVVQDSRAGKLQVLCFPELFELLGGSGLARVFPDLPSLDRALRCVTLPSSGHTFIIGP